jgi:hypothetical protein
MNWLQSFFSTPARQAMGWTGLGILGIVFAALGVWFLTDDGGKGTVTASEDRTPAATTTATRSATATPAATRTPGATATSLPRQTGGGGAANPPQQQAPEPTATPTPTAAAAVAGGEYCPNVSSSMPPNSVFGLFTIGGAPAPAGTEVGLAFDGVVGPVRATAEAGGYRVDYNASIDTCANRVGAAISIYHNGVLYPTGQVVGGGPAFRFDLAVP